MVPSILHPQDTFQIVFCPRYYTYYKNVNKLPQPWEIIKYLKIIAAMFSLFSAATIILFSFESFHFIGHCLIMFRVRQLPRKDFVRMRIYFLVDLTTVFLSSFVVLQKYQWLTAIQTLQHLYYFIFWEKTDMAKKIVSWSSLDWTKTKLYDQWHIGSILGTLFDVLIHLLMCISLGQQLSTVQVIFSFLIGQSWMFYVLTTPKYAWSSPWAMPLWVEKRIQPISIE